MAKMEHAAALARNPFEITKASYFTDQQINDYWVDLPHGKGFADLVCPNSLLPKFILGGKGSGKTHLMRHFSYELQKLRHNEDIHKGIASDGYIGLYHLFSGLDCGRFSGKGFSDDKWDLIFPYYQDLSLVIRLLDIILDIQATCIDLIESEEALCLAVSELFSHAPKTPPSTLKETINVLREKKLAVGHAVNNCALTEKLDVVIDTSRGQLIFDVSLLIQEHIPSFQNIVFLFLLDELENLSVNQQKYINTLMRDSKAPCSFRVGSRLYGIKTHQTFSDGEINREGAEYEEVELDQFLRDSKDNYQEFSEALLARRIVESGFYSHSQLLSVQKRLSDFFETPEKSQFFDQETAFVLEKYQDKPRPYFQSVKKALLSDKLGNISKQDAEDILNYLSYPKYPIMEKVSLLIFYKSWADGETNLVECAMQIGKDARSFVEKNSDVRHKHILAHFGHDLLAQLYRECSRSLNYNGLQTFIDMSCGMPRNLLIILKHIYKWAIFNGESPLTDTPISKESQTRGVKEASQWFYKTARLIGSNEKPVLNSISRVAELFKELRYANRLVDPSLITFSYSERNISSVAADLISTAEKWSLLISIDKGNKDKNSMVVEPKYQLNRMLAPHWDLPIYRRGTLFLQPKFIDAIFSTGTGEEFSALKNERIASQTAPFSKVDNPAQRYLF